MKVQDPHAPCAAVEYDEAHKSYALLLSFVPFIEAAKINTEIIILVDRSGSMGGEPILQARKTLTAMLAAMPQDVYFNIVGFGSSFQLLFPKSMVRSDANMETALRSIETLEANLGGCFLWHKTMKSKTQWSFPLPCSFFFKKCSFQSFQALFFERGFSTILQEPSSWILSVQFLRRPHSPIALAS